MLNLKSIHINAAHPKDNPFNQPFFIIQISTKNKSLSQFIIHSFRSSISVLQNQKSNKRMSLSIQN